MLLCLLKTKSGVHVYRRTDADLMRRVDHRPRQVEGQARMAKADVCRVIAQAVIASGKDGDAGDISLPKRRLELLLSKVRTDIFQIRLCVKVQMHLPPGIGQGVIDIKLHSCSPYILTAPAVMPEMTNFCANT